MFCLKLYVSLLLHIKQFISVLVLFVPVDFVVEKFKKGSKSKFLQYYGTYNCPAQYLSQLYCLHNTHTIFNVRVYTKNRLGGLGISKAKLG